MSDHDTHAMSTPIEQIIPGFRRTGLKRRYDGRHNINIDTPRRRSRIRDVGTAIRTTAANTWRILRNALKADLTAAAAIVRAFDTAAYARIPATWRHRLEQSAQQRRQKTAAVAATELWWAGRSGDYPILIPTQPLKIIEADQ